jgi:putative NADPH-quinone reductase
VSLCFVIKTCKSCVTDLLEQCKALHLIRCGVSPAFFSYEFDKWVQGVLSYGYAYKYNEQGMPEGLLNGRAFEFHTTQGTPEAYATVMRENMKQRLEVGIFGFCNAKVDVIFHQV